MCLFITDLSSLVELATSNKEFCKIIEVPSLDNLHTNAFANQGFSESLMKNNLFKNDHKAPHSVKVWCYTTTDVH